MFGGCLQLLKTALMKYFVYQKLTQEEISEMFCESLPMAKYRIRVTGVTLIKSGFKY
jgi:hypothetical protein